jgi:hypothetical protein
MHMDMIFTHYSFQYCYVFSITDLHDEFTATEFYISLEDWVAVLCYPDEMSGYTSDGVTIIAEMVGHDSIVLETESLALKCIV